jgi:methyltransferase-like protein
VDSDLSSRFRKKEDIVTRRIAGETLLVPVYGDLANMERIFTLDPVAAFIWEQLDGEKSLEDIRDGVLGAFDVKEEQAETDIFEFIEELLKADLIDQAK